NDAETTVRAGLTIEVPACYSQALTPPDLRVRPEIRRSGGAGRPRSSGRRRRDPIPWPGPPRARTGRPGPPPNRAPAPPPGTTAGPLDAPRRVRTCRPGGTPGRR